MAIEFNCSCGKRLSVPDNSAGRKAKCPGCGAVLDIPSPEPAPQQTQVETAENVVDRLSADIAESRERAPQLTQIAVALAILAVVSLVLTFFAFLHMIVVWILVWLPVSAAGGLLALGMIKADHRTPGFAQSAAPVIVGINWLTLWMAAAPGMTPGKLLTLLIALANLGAYGFLFWYFRRHDTLLLFPEETEEAEGAHNESPQPRGVEEK